MLVWASLDPPVIEGLQTALDERAADAGITVQVEAVEDINSLIMQRIQAGDTPDITDDPATGCRR